MVDTKKLRAYADRVKQASEGLDRRIIARVAGVTFEERQGILARVGQNTPIKLERDRRNEYDFYAVKVMAEVENNWEHVGFLPKAMSRKISASLDKGVPLSARVHRRKGGMKSDHTGEQLHFGLDICIEPE